MRVHVDTNVLLDVLAKREPFWRNSARVWTLAESGQITAFISAISFNNCFYVVRKLAGSDRAYQTIRLLRDVFQPVDLSAQLLTQAIDAGFTDFEDAIQYVSAIHAQAQALITRNPDDFPRTGLSVLTPTEFLATRSRS